MWFVFVVVFFFGVELLFFDEFMNDFDDWVLIWFEDCFVVYWGVLVVVMYDCDFLDCFVMVVV